MHGYSKRINYKHIRKNCNENLNAFMGSNVACVFKIQFLSQQLCRAIAELYL